MFLFDSGSRFHVDKLSSAHVYLRLKEGETLDDVPTNVIEEAAQLVKANSIQVSKNILVKFTFVNLSLLKDRSNYTHWHVSSFACKW